MYWLSDQIVYARSPVLVADQCPVVHALPSGGPGVPAAERPD